jgi:hypothetical protein
MCPSGHSPSYTKHPGRNKTNNKMDSETAWPPDVVCSNSRCLNARYACMEVSSHTSDTPPTVLKVYYMHAACDTVAEWCSKLKDTTAVMRSKQTSENVQWWGWSQVKKSHQCGTAQTSMLNHWILIIYHNIPKYEGVGLQSRTKQTWLSLVLLLIRVAMTVLCSVAFTM